MHEGLRESMRWPSCVCGITPDNDGTAFSSFSSSDIASILPHEPANWNSEIYPNYPDAWVNAYLQAHPLDDYRLEIKFRLEEGYRANVYLAGNTGFGIFVQPAGAVQFFNYGCGLISDNSRFTFTPNLNQEYHVVIERSGGTAQIVLDDEVVRSYTGTNVDYNNTVVTMIRRTGILTFAQWTNLTTGELFFNYPESQSVNQNMLFQFSTDTSQGCFVSKYENPAGMACGAVTNLNLAGSMSSYTLAAEFEIPSHEVGTAAWWIIAGQGNVGGSAPDFQIGMGVNQTATGTKLLYFRVSLGGVIRQVTKDFTSFFGRRVSVIAVFDRATAQNKLYVDGVYSNYAPIATPNEPINPNVAINTPDKYFGSWNAATAARPNTQKVYGIVLYNKALTDGEIAFISAPKQAFQTAYRKWEIQHDAGRFYVVFQVGTPPLYWELADGTTSTGLVIDKTLPAGTSRVWGDFNKISTLLTSVGVASKYVKLNEIPRITGLINLANGTMATGKLSEINTFKQVILSTFPFITGRVKDLNKALSQLHFTNLPLVEYDCEEVPSTVLNILLIRMPKVANFEAFSERRFNTVNFATMDSQSWDIKDAPTAISLILDGSGFIGELSNFVGKIVTGDALNISNTLVSGNTEAFPTLGSITLYNNRNLVGDAGNLALSTGPSRRIYSMVSITGALKVSPVNTSIFYYANTNVSPEEYDETIQNVVDLGTSNGTLAISSRRTSASDANVALLRSRGWTVTDTVA